MTHYQVLGLTKGATTSEIKARYRALAKRYHPDINGNNQAMSRINEAYGVLSDPLNRFRYDQGLSSASIPSNPPKPKSPPIKPQYYSQSKKIKTKKIKIFSWKFKFIGSAIAAYIITVLVLALIPQKYQQPSSINTSHKQSAATSSSSNSSNALASVNKQSPQSISTQQNIQNTQSANLQEQSLNQQRVADLSQHDAKIGNRFTPNQQRQQCLSRTPGAFNQQQALGRIIALEEQIAAINTNSGRYQQLVNELQTLETQYNSASAFINYCYRS